VKFIRTIQETETDIVTKCA